MTNINVDLRIFSWKKFLTKTIKSSQKSSYIMFRQFEAKQFRTSFMFMQYDYNGQIDGGQ